MTLVIVCDGMGGLHHGAEAAQLIAQSIDKHLRDNFNIQAPEQSITNAILFANDQIARECLALNTRMGAAVGLTTKFHYP